MSNKTTQPLFPRGKKAGLDAERASAHLRQTPHIALSLLVMPALTLSQLPAATAADPHPAPPTPTTTQPTAKPCTPGYQPSSNPQSPRPPVAPSPSRSIASRGDRSGRYLLGPGDFIFVEVQPYNNFNFNSSINPEGSIILPPPLGPLVLRGLTIEQAQNLIQSQLNQYLVNPFVRLSLLQQRPVNITVTGEVGVPGFYTLPGQEAKLAGAIRNAGGASPTADLRNVRLRWRTADGQRREQPLDLLTPLETGEALPDITLEDGDTIFIPKRPLEQESPLALRSSLASSQSVPISVLGEVARPGFYDLPAGPRPLATALLTASGATPAADLRRVQVCRQLADGNLSPPVVVDLYAALQAGGDIPEIALGSGDVVFIPKLELRRDDTYDNTLVGNSNLAAPQTVAVSVLGEVLQPGFYNVGPSLRSVADALLAAGKTTPAADLRRVTIQRLGADGKVSTLEVDLFTPLQTGGQVPDIRLANGDVVLVPKLELNQNGEYDSRLVSRSSLAAQQPVQVTVLGEVAQPGFHDLPPSQRPVPAALLIAGGSTADADLREVRVRRLLPDGKVSEEVVDLFTPLQTGAELPDVYLAAGDVVFVPKLQPGTDDDYDRQLVARSGLGKEQILVRILSYPGQGASVLPLPNGSSFGDIVSSIPIGQADMRDITLVRFDPVQGRAITRTIDAKELLKGDISQNIPLQDNDVIVIGRNLTSKITYALGTYTQPFRDVLGFLLFFDQIRNTTQILFGSGSNSNSN